MLILHHVLANLHKNHLAVHDISEPFTIHCKHILNLSLLEIIEFKSSFTQKLNSSIHTENEDQSFCMRRNELVNMVKVKR